MPLESFRIRNGVVLCICVGKSAVWGGLMLTAPPGPPIRLRAAVGLTLIEASSL